MNREQLCEICLRQPRTAREFPLWPRFCRFDLVADKLRKDTSIVGQQPLRILMFDRKKKRIDDSQSILLVDDDKGQLQVFSTWMAAVLPNAHIQTASSVQEALKLISSHQFSLVISDYSIPHAGAGLDIFEAAVQSGISKSNFIILSGTTDNLPHEIRLISKGDLIALEAAIHQALT